MSDHAICQRLDWDTEFFGYNIAKLTKPVYNNDQYGKISKEAKNCGYRLIYYFIPVEDKKANDFAVDKKLFLADIKTVFLRTIHYETDFEVEPRIQSYIDPAPDEKLYQLTLAAGIYSRYKIDPMFRSNEYERLYRKWIEKSVTREIADDILVFVDRGMTLGLITVGKKGQRGDIGLVAVAAEARGMGIGSKLVQAALNWFKYSKINTVQVVTQGNNIEACRLYEKNGFVIDIQTNIYHCWI